MQRPASCWNPGRVPTAWPPPPCRRLLLRQRPKGRVGARGVSTLCGPEDTSGPLRPASPRARISATCNRNLGSRDQGSKAFRLLNYFLQRNSSSQRRTGNQIRSKALAHSRGQIFNSNFAQRSLDEGPQEGPVDGALITLLWVLLLRARGITRHPGIQQQAPQRGPPEPHGRPAELPGKGGTLASLEGAE